MALHSFGPLSLALMDYHLERGGMQLLDAVRAKCKRGVTTENQVVAAWLMAKVCVLDACVSII